MKTTEKPNPKGPSTVRSIKSTPSMHRTNMYFTTPQVEELSALSDSTGLSVAEHVRRAVDEYLVRLPGRRKKRT